MTTEMVTQKGSGLSKTSRAVKHFATRIERARQLRNERVARADAEYVDAVDRAVADVKATTVADVSGEQQPTNGHVGDDDIVRGEVGYMQRHDTPVAP